MGLGLMALSPVAAHAGPADLLYERAVLRAAGEKCGFFSPTVAVALGAGVAQARSAALRTGLGSEWLDELMQKARASGGRADCDAPRTQAAAARVRSAFAGFEKVTRLDYPGEVAGWRADRTATRTIRWRLSQDTSFGRDRMTFGLAGAEGTPVLLALGAFADQAKPSSARLVMRAGARAPTPYIAAARATGALLPLPQRMPPPSALRTFTAEARSAAGQDLLPGTASTGWAFRFPAAAADKLAALDPREAVAIEFLFPDGRVRRAFVEVGDFAAARAFVQLATR